MTDPPRSVLLIADAGSGAGWGHLARTGVLGDAIRERLDAAARVVVTSPRAHDVAGWPGEAPLPTPVDHAADIVVIDLLDAEEREVHVERARTGGATVAVIVDDDAVVDADVVICPGPHAATVRLDAPEAAVVGRGLRYALVPRRTGGDPHAGEPRRGTNVVVSLGGSERAGHAALFASWVEELGVEVDLVLPRSSVGAAACGGRVHIAPSPAAFGAMIAGAAAVVVAPGVSALEALAVATPTVLVALHDDHDRVVDGFVACGLALDGGRADRADPIRFRAAVGDALGSTGRRLRENCRATDLSGGGRRCAETILLAHAAGGRR